MSIFVIGSTKNIFPELDEGREKFLVDVPHDGDNIDHLNPWYCELTGLYYMWKHSTAKFVGLEHYRRFFASPKRNKSRMTIQEAEKILEDHDIILCNYRHEPDFCAYKYFQRAGKIDDLDQFIDMLDEKFYPLGTQFKAYTCERSLRQCNMFIARREIMVRYCEWLFPKLAMFDKYIGIDDRNLRIDGYLAEHIFGLWVRQQKLKVYDAVKVEMHFIEVSGSKKP